MLAAHERRQQMTVRFTLASTLRRDGLTIDDSTVTIHQRTMGKGDITIPAKEVTHVSTHRPALTLPLLEAVGTLELRVGSKKYALRRLPLTELEQAETVLRTVIG
jgi:hypothetical protein